MKGIYLYGVRNGGGKGLKIKGIDGKSHATRIPFKDIEAIVSTVNTDEFCSEEVARRAKEDIDWIIKYAQKHEKVIEHAMSVGGQSCALIPMKFGTIFERPQNLEDILRNNYSAFKSLLSRIEGKQEWSVKIYVNEGALKEKIKTNESSIQEKVDENAGLPRGADYFGELEVEDKLTKLTDRECDRLSANFFDQLSSCSAEAQTSKLLSKEIAGHSEPMVLNSAYLIPHDSLDKFVKVVGTLQESHPEFIFESTGPWPPYNFVI
jgi:hypothetical protein